MKKLSMLFIVILSISIIPIGYVEAEVSDINEERIYNIFIDRFNNGNHSITEQVNIDDPYAYHGGDLEGITLKLDDIQQLGFTTISLSPIFANAPNGYHGYWVEDFFEVEEQFGTMEDLQNLVEEAHARDMKVILEFVTNYVSTSHRMVTDEWIVEDAAASDEREAWLDDVVILDQANSEVQEYLLEAAEFWMEEANIDGYKLHAANQTSAEFLTTFTAYIKELNPNFYLIADLLHDEQADHVYTEPNIDAVENLAMYEALTDVFAEPDQAVSTIYDIWETTNDKKGLLFVDDPFMERFTQTFSENGRNALTTWKLALTYMYTTPGIPILFQGSEIPMYGDFPENQRLVDFNSGEADLKEFYTRISSLHEEFLPLQYGDFELVGTDRGMSVFRRSYEGETMYIAINNDSESRAVSITDLDEGMQLRGLLGDNIVRQLDNGEYKIGIARETAEVFIIEENTGLNWVFIAPIAAVLVIFVAGIIYLSRKQKKQS
ncbi:alpha-amylase [Ornithinibacillus sp. L9]|uniref:Alpha-amylase n=1 Tax=Ornithinibacillus caprae TaxID=2678566 RepID=A0A6N8FKF5_9BACI|nr:alpha-amylase family glycosyl hydrolase [Ornithinibacillus caprae]MUK90132.1 alpha-amylase [Ornithinibacillus caprae]